MTGRPSAKRSTIRRPRSRTSEIGADVIDAVVGELQAIERDGGDGTLALPGSELPVTNLDKVYFPADGVTKGDVMRFYARLAPALLRAIADRPLVLRRYPGGIAGPSFHQHDPGPNTPSGVRTASVVGEPGSAAERRLIGGDLATLLYTVQLGAIPVNAWHSRVGSIESPDYAVLDLDPHPQAGFDRVVSVARVVHAALIRRGRDAVVKTSGSRGIHILVPLDRGATYDQSAALAEEVAVEIADANPDLATAERSLAARQPGTIYVDHLQNAAGKTLTTVFSVRARAGALVSTPLAWSQVTRVLNPERYTIATVTRQRARHMARWTDAP